MAGGDEDEGNFRVTLVRDFARSINQIPMVLRKENHGYLFNAMYSPLNAAAIALVANGVALVHDVGLVTALHIAESSNVTGDDLQNRKNAEFLKREYADKGWLGVRTGRGFYTYPNPAYRDPDFLMGKGK